MIRDLSAQLVEFAREIAAATPDFQAVRGPGAGDRATHAFMGDLRERAKAAFGVDCAEQRICGETAFAPDYYFREEGTIVEVALGLPNPASEFEKDILKAIIAQDYGYPVRRLVFISRAGAAKKCSQPGRSAFIRWAKTKHQIDIEVCELGGEPRRRHRAPRGLLESGAPAV